MSELASTPPPKKSRLYTIWAVVITTLGGVAAGYLVAVWKQPELVARYMPVFRAEVADAGTASALAQEVETLRGSVGQVQMDVAKIKVEVHEQSERGKHFADRLNSLESRPALAPDAARESSANGSTANGGTEPVPFSLISGPEKVEAAPPAPAEQPAAEPTAAAEIKEIVVSTATPGARKAPTALETGSVARAAAPVAFGAPVVKPAAPKLSGIQLGTGTSVDEIRLSWLALSDRHSAELKNLQPRYVVGRNGNGQTYNLLAGPLKSSADAKRVCAALEGAGVPCSVGSFNGNAL